MTKFEALEIANLFSKRPNPVEGDTQFYHTMDLPEPYGTVFGPWDLRSETNLYLGRVDYLNRTVLEIGPASGFVTFSLEQRGALVVAVDLPLNAKCDLFPTSPSEVADMRQTEFASRRALRNSFWTAHQAFGSRARLIEADVHNLHPSVTGFDVGIVCNVMQHLKDPVGMLIDLAERVETVVVTEADWFSGKNDAKPVMELVTEAIRAGKIYSWFIVSPKLVEDVLALKGFTILARDYHYQRFVPAPSQAAELVPHYTITATKHLHPEPTG